MQITVVNLYCAAWLLLRQLQREYTAQTRSTAVGLALQTCLPLCICCLAYAARSSAFFNRVAWCQPPGCCSSVERSAIIKLHQCCAQRRSPGTTTLLTMPQLMHLLCLITATEPLARGR